MKARERCLCNTSVELAVNARLRLWAKSVVMTAVEDKEFNDWNNNLINQIEADQYRVWVMWVGAETLADPDGIKHSLLIGWDLPVSAGTMSAKKWCIIKYSECFWTFSPLVHLDATVNYLKVATFWAWIMWNDWIKFARIFKIQAECLK